MVKSSISCSNFYHLQYFFNGRKTLVSQGFLGTFLSYLKFQAWKHIKKCDIRQCDNKCLK